MKHKEITTTLTVCTPAELTPAERELVDAARQSARNAYAPYSQFHVGAAIRLDDGTIVKGANQENAAFPSGTCAERSAAFWAHANYPDRRFVAIAIAALGADMQPVVNAAAPCGACRQALLEYEKLAGQGIKVYLASRDEIIILDSIRALLPLAFTDF